MKQFHGGALTVDKKIDATINGIQIRMGANHTHQHVETFTQVRALGIQVKVIVFIE